MASSNTISSEQNSESSLRMLRAQSRLHSEAKICQNVQFVFCVLIVMALSVTRIFCKIELLSQIALLYSIAISFIKPLLFHCKQTKEDLAIRIQQLFDTTLYHLEWEDWLCGDKPNMDDIRKYSNKIHSEERFMNWYAPEVGQEPLKVAALICIRSNVFYSRTLRTKCQKWIVCAISIVVLVLFIFNFSMNDTFMNILLYQVAPLSPIIVWGWDIYHQISKNLVSLERIRKKLDEALNSGNADKISNKQLSQLQNMLFLYRKSNCLIPDWVYYHFRSDNEKEMSDMVKTFISNKH